MKDNPRYRRNFLKSVIARADFPYPIGEVKERIPDALIKAAKVPFPILEPSKSIAAQLQISPKKRSVKPDFEEVTEWRFFNQDRSRSLVLIPNALFVEFKEYTAFQSLREAFWGCLSTFLDSIDVQVSRLGLRYINNIELGTGEPQDWKGLIDDNMLCGFSVYPRRSEVSRVFNILELNLGDYNLRMQYGMHNPDYPAPITKRIFVLDLDAYSSGIQDKTDVATNLDKFHTKIEGVFESSITDKLRGLLNE